MRDSPNTAALLLHDQVLEIEGESTFFGKSPYFTFAQKIDYDTCIESQSLNGR